MNENDEHLIPLCNVDGSFFDDSNNISLIPNKLANPNSIVDDAEVFSVLQFGAIIPPLSPWKGIQRLLPGYKYHKTKMVGPAELQQEKGLSKKDSKQQAKEIERKLDHILQKKLKGRDDPVLLFSGGVDSGIIASRLVALGYYDSLLINYSFGDDDPESKLAEAMARELGLKYERVSAKRKRGDSCLLEPGKIYPQPFADYSAVPTANQAHAVVEHLAGQQRIILDSTGADGAFGMTNKIKLWERVNRIPTILRKMSSFSYGDKLWRRPGRIEYLARISRRSIDMPLLSAVIAQNPLAGTFYSADQRDYVDHLLSIWLAGWAGKLPLKKLVAADLALTCANIFAQKSKPILEVAGHSIVYPFLDHEMVAMALSSIPHWQMDKPKAPLKLFLSHYVPHEMVFRPKSGFVDPKGEVFYSSEFVDYLNTATNSTSPISHLLERKPLAKACDLLRKKKTLPPQTLSLLWAIVFTDRWYRTAF